MLLASDKQTGETKTTPPASLTSAMMANQGKTGYVEEIDSASGRNALTGYARMAGSPGAPGLRWRILVQVDRAEVLQSIWTVLWKLVGITEICLIPLLGLFYWTRHRQSIEEARAALARRALEANEARIRKIVDIALDAVITIDTDLAVELKPDVSPITLARGQETDLPASAKISFVSSEGDYRQAVAEARRAEAEGRRARAEAEADALRAEAEAMRGEVDAMRGEVDAGRTRVAELEAELARLRR